MFNKLFSWPSRGSAKVSPALASLLPNKSVQIHRAAAGGPDVPRLPVARELFLSDINPFSPPIAPATVSAPQIEIPLGQAWFILLLKILGYKVDLGGMCFGMTASCIRYALNGQLTEFFKLLNFIHHTWLLSPDLKRVQDKILIIWKLYSSTHSKSFASKENLVDPFEALEMKACVELGISPAEYRTYRRFLRAVQLVFDDVVLTQMCRHYKEISMGTHAPYDLLHHMNYGLEKENIRYIKTVPLVFCGTQELLVDFLTQVSGQLESVMEQPLQAGINVVFRLDTENHSIALVYKKSQASQERNFFLIDANRLREVSRPFNITETAQAIATAEDFIENRTISFVCEIVMLNQVASYQTLKKIEVFFDAWDFTVPNNNNDLEMPTFSRLLRLCVTCHYIKGLAKLSTHPRLLELLVSLNDQGVCALMMALSLDQSATLTFLEEAMERQNLPIQGNETALHLAVAKGKCSTVDALLKGKANPNAVTQGGWSVLHTASGQGDAAIVKILLERGVRINAATKAGVTPLMVAAQYGRVDIVKMLILHGADLCQRDNQNKNMFNVAHPSVRALYLKEDEKVLRKLKNFESTAPHISWQAQHKIPESVAQALKERSLQLNELFTLDDLYIGYSLGYHYRAGALPRNVLAWEQTEEGKLCLYVDRVGL
jgi:hypothetical protein